jgi:hypothetical protein
MKQEKKDASKTIEEQFLTALDKYLVKSRSTAEEERKQRLAFNPSSVYKCQRQIWYKLKGYKGNKKVYARSVRILEVGTALHEWVQREVFMDMNLASDSQIKLIPLEELPSYGVEGIEFLREHHAPPMEVKYLDRRWTKKIPISAMVDGALSFKGEYMLFEFKTINPDDFKLLIEPLKDHVKQGSVYSMSLDVPKVIFVYFNKGDQNWKAFIYTYDESQYKWVQHRLQTIEEHYVDDTLPPAEASDQCQWCPFKKLCEANVSTQEE